MHAHFCMIDAATPFAGWTNFNERLLVSVSFSLRFFFLFVALDNAGKLPLKHYKFNAFEGGFCFYSLIFSFSFQFNFYSITSIACKVLDDASASCDIVDSLVKLCGPGKAFCEMRQPKSTLKFSSNKSRKTKNKKEKGKLNKQQAYLGHNVKIVRWHIKRVKGSPWRM